MYVQTVLAREVAAGWLAGWLGGQVKIDCFGLAGETFEGSQGSSETIVLAYFMPLYLLAYFMPQRHRALRWRCYAGELFPGSILIHNPCGGASENQKLVST
jgi:hypothetical protein